MTSDEVELGAVVAGVVAARLDHHSLARRLARAAAGEERVRLARDLHDGVLQSLTGIALRLEAVRRTGDPGGQAGAGLEEVQRLIVQEQRDLRFFIDELRPVTGGEASPLAVRLSELVDRLERQWDLAVELEGDGSDVSEAQARDVYHLVREALVNAVRHGGARRVRVVVRGGPEGTALEIADDGHGFPFTGRYGGEELAAMGEGPKSLRERVAALGGRLELETGADGARLDIVLPPPGRAA
jgi:signal transduction histidine kinase